MEFKLRPFREEDLPSLVKYANNPKIASNLTDAFPNPYTEEAGRSFIAMAMSHQPTQIMTIDIHREASGGHWITPQR